MRDSKLAPIMRVSQNAQYELETGVIGIIGLIFIAAGSLGSLWLFVGNLSSIFPALIGEHRSLVVGGGFVVLFVVGIVMLITKSDSCAPYTD